MNKRSQESNEEVISIAQALGGKTNVKHVEVKGSRLTAYIEQMDKINYEVLEKIGTGGVITMETKIILVLGNRAIPVAALLK